MRPFVALALMMTVSGSAYASEPLQAIVQSYLAIQSQLASDKFDAVKVPARAIAVQAAAMGQNGVPIAEAAAKLEAAADINAARDAFGALTDAVMAAGKAEGWKDVEGVRLAFCPMVNRSWLQKEDKIRNPYYGSTMLECGQFKEKTK